LFTLARKLSPCIIFVDEVDALLDARSNSSAKTSRIEIINEFMGEWDGLLSKNQGVTVMAATNRPYALDDAVLRRLPRRILVDLPDPSARFQILKILLKEDTISPDISLQDIADRCEFYSGSDLKNMSMAAAMRALRRIREAGGGNEEVFNLEITLEDFEGAMKDVPASISDRMVTVHELREWDKLYGEGRAQKSNSLRFGFLL
jgi:SpoVK/Ycf46/Vps4 family AAA+-type ATPase